MFAVQKGLLWLLAGLVVGFVVTALVSMGSAL